MAWNAEVIVTGANPAPGFIYTPGFSNEGRGLNVYIAGGTGPSGALPVYIANAASGGVGQFVDITSPLLNGAVWVTGSVWVLNPSSGSAGGEVTVSGTASVWVTNLPLQVSGNVGVVGTASVNVVSLPTPLQVTGTVAVEGVTVVTGTVALESSGVFVQNLPATQSVFVVNQTQAAITGVIDVNVVSGALSATVVVPAPASAALGLFPFSPVAVQLLPASPGRITFSIYNDADQYFLVRLGGVADQTNYTLAVPPFFFYESPYPSWQGTVSGVGWSGGAYPGSGTIHVTEQSP
jgi:hypothetical protein